MTVLEALELEQKQQEREAVASKPLPSRKEDPLGYKREWTRRRRMDPEYRKREKLLEKLRKAEAESGRYLACPHCHHPIKVVVAGNQHKRSEGL